MKEIVKVLLQEGIDEDTIHEVLDIIEEAYETVSETSDERKLGLLKGRLENRANSLRTLSTEPNRLNFVRHKINQAKTNRAHERVLKSGFKNPESYLKAGDLFVSAGKAGDDIKAKPIAAERPRDERLKHVAKAAEPKHGLHPDKSNWGAIKDTRDEKGNVK